MDLIYLPETLTRTVYKRMLFFVFQLEFAKVVLLEKLLMDHYTNTTS